MTLKSVSTIVIGDSTVWGTGESKWDSRMVCCLPDARVQDISQWLQDILRRRGSNLRLLCTSVPMTQVRQRMRFCRVNIRKWLESRTSNVVIFESLLVPHAGEDRGRRVRDVNMWLSWCRGQVSMI